ncbi:MAG: phosphopantetheine-binding protein [Chloroflexota bacterium]
MTDVQPAGFNPFLDAPDLEQIQHHVAQHVFPRPALEAAYAAPRTPTERVLADIWSNLLHVEPVGLDDDFFMLGGHSITATQALARANEAFGIDVPISVFFSNQHFTIRALAQLVDQHQLEGVDEGELSALLDELDGLSDDEIQALLDGAGENG